MHAVIRKMDDIDSVCSFASFRIYIAALHYNYNTAHVPSKGLQGTEAMECSPRQGSYVLW